VAAVEEMLLMAMRSRSASPRPATLA